MYMEWPPPDGFQAQLHAEGIDRYRLVVHMEDELAGEQGAGAALWRAIEDERRRFNNHINRGWRMGERFRGALCGVRETL